MDRVRLGHVVDFIDVGAWPVFNMADSAIVVGLIGLLWTLMSTKDRSVPEPEPSEEGMLLPIAFAEEGVLGSEFETTSVSNSGDSEKKEEPWE